MARLGMFRSLWLTRLSQPAGERIIYRHALKSPPRRILELGLGTLNRTERLLDIARTAVAVADITYVGVDPFEGRGPGDPPGVSLKDAHRRLHDRAKVQLVPGGLDSLSRVCNRLTTFDLVVIAAPTDERQMSRCWFFLQRLTSPQTTIFTESASHTWSLMTKASLDALASQSVLQRAG